MTLLKSDQIDNIQLIQMPDNHMPAKQCHSVELIAKSANLSYIKKKKYINK